MNSQHYRGKRPDMKHETKAWMEQAGEDMETAVFNLEGNHLNAAALFAQQAVEKALKAHSIEHRGTFKKIHDLVELGRDAGLPAEFTDDCVALSSAYIATRYPDSPGAPAPDEVGPLVRRAKEVIEWVKTKIV